MSFLQTVSCCCCKIFFVEKIKYTISFRFLLFRNSSRIEVFQDLSLPIPSKDELSALRCEDKIDKIEHTEYLYVFNAIWDWFRSFFWGPAPTLEDCFSAFFSSDELKGNTLVKKHTVYSLNFFNHF